MHIRYYSQVYAMHIYTYMYMYTLYQVTFSYAFRSLSHHIKLQLMISLLLETLVGLISWSHLSHSMSYLRCMI